jgi:hypothetical protein
MSKRIRYDKTREEGKLVSKHTYISKKTGAKYKVFLDVNEKTYKIKNIGSERITKSGGENINNLNVLKRTVKRELEQLGVSFEVEIRDREFGRCEKGYTQAKHEEQE